MNFMSFIVDGDGVSLTDEPEVEDPTTERSTYPSEEVRNKHPKKMIILRSFRREVLKAVTKTQS